MKKGFTLLEILVTLVLLTSGIVAIVRVMGMGMFADANAEKSIIARYLAQEQMETIKDASSYSNIDSFASARTSLSGDFSDFDREVTVSGNPKEVHVIVYWTVQGQDQSVDFVTLFTDYDF